MYKKPQMNKIDTVSPIRKNTPDDIFITCGSFEERCLAVPKKCETNFAQRILLFRFLEPNVKRDNFIKDMESLLKVESIRSRYYTIGVEHGKITESIFKLHNYFKSNHMLDLKDGIITIDISTFTKSLLLDILFYIKYFLKITKLRLLYTTPRNYASPDEGNLSYGTKSICTLPSYWNGWVSTKDACLAVILGYEEMRAWSLVNKFDANINLLFVTKPGAIPKWDTYCEKYNAALLENILPTDNIPALDPDETANIIGRHITDNLAEKHNLFLCPLGTKPQIIGVFLYLLRYPKIPLNIITTTPIEHNIPYYSWGIGETYEYFLSLPEESFLLNDRSNKLLTKTRGYP